MNHTDPGLTQLVYVSRRLPSVTDEQVVDGIVFPAMRFNRSRDITGCLWVGKEHFVQVLEGVEEEVESLYKRIERDPRHEHVTLLECAPLRAREYARFAMRLIRGPEHEEIERVMNRWAHAPALSDLKPSAPPPPIAVSATALAGKIGRLLLGRTAV